MIAADFARFLTWPDSLLPFVVVVVGRAICVAHRGFITSSRIRHLRSPGGHALSRGVAAGGRANPLADAVRYAPGREPAHRA